MKINTNYLDKFINSSMGYLYSISKGSYLCFDKETFEYLGVIEYYPRYKIINIEATELLEKLYSKSILL